MWSLPDRRANGPRPPWLRRARVGGSPFGGPRSPCTGFNARYPASPDMKTKIVAAFLALAAMLTAACEQHKWSETSQLFKKHSAAGHHTEAGESGHAAPHGEKKAEGHAEAPKHP